MRKVLNGIVEKMDKEFSLRALSTCAALMVVFLFLWIGSYWWLVLVFNLCILATFELNNLRRAANESYITNLVSIFFIFLGFWAMNDVDKEAPATFLFVVIISGISFYIGDKFIGGPKLQLKANPKKTYAGLILALIATQVFVLLLLLPFDSSNSESNLPVWLVEYRYLVSFIIAIVLTLLTLYGELTISTLKKKAKVETTGQIIPGYGGVLDMVGGYGCIATILGYLKFGELVVKPFWEQVKDIVILAFNNILSALNQLLLLL